MIFPFFDLWRCHHQANSNCGPKLARTGSAKCRRKSETCNLNDRAQALITKLPGYFARPVRLHFIRISINPLN
jgi:hypothetical protein